MKTSLSIFLLFLLPQLLPGQFQSLIEDYLEGVNASHEIPGSAVAILRGDEVIYEGYFGMAELNHRVPVSEQTMFRVYSSTKLVISVAIFQLIEAKKISLSATIGTYLQDIPASWKDRTVADLLAHASGLPDFVRLESGISETALMASLEKEDLYFPASAAFNYNQTNYWMLARIIEHASEMPLEEFVTKGQFPEMANEIVFSSNALEVIPNRSGKYNYTSRGWELSGDQAGRFGHAGNGLASSLPALTYWAQRLHRDELLGADAGAMMVSEYTFSNPNDKFLHGWGLYPVNEQTSYGFTGGGVSGIRVFPEQDLTIIFLSNGYRYFPIHNQVINRLAGIVNQQLNDPNSISRDELTSLLLGPKIDDALKAFPAWRKQHPNIQLEGSLNSIGYALARDGRVEDGIKVFHLNTKEYPDAWNVWDSLGEGYEMAGSQDKALKYYTQSVKINPDNQHGVDRIKQLNK
jgi:CubicO group peptidase (beta-lactamase class C family)